MSLPALDTITGTILIGTWAGSFLYMAELIQARYYFRHFKQDDWKLKTFVSVALLVDTVSTVGDYACVYLYTITHAGDPVYLADEHWPISLYLFTTAVIAVLVQSFLVIRYWWFTRNILVTLLNSFLIVVSFGGSFACGVMVTMFPASNEREKVKIPTTIWLATEAVADLSIAVVLLWQLRKARPTLMQTRSTLNTALDRLVALTIQTGTATATLAVATLIAFLLKEESNVAGGIGYMLGHVSRISTSGGRAGLRLWPGGGVSCAVSLGTLAFPTSIVTDNSASSHCHHTVDMDPQGGRDIREQSC
ncbi:hypothetical protein MVEN_01627200 [Mycena venus]|uniref:DUF6534 domain-containing protein n=1 Tax=Mycena venus TaxID=2733690 RepID=A0A8H6XMW9_9AGAR|nr:hypothetical protein MVEN_01627200 [Mycena venus]